MSKILVEVRVPAAGLRCDVLVPYEVRVHEVRRLLRQLLAAEAPSGGDTVGETVLCDGRTGAVLDLNSTPVELGLENGSRLMLI